MNTSHRSIRHQQNLTAWWGKRCSSYEDCSNSKKPAGHMRPFVSGVEASCQTGAIAAWKLLEGSESSKTLKWWRTTAVSQTLHNHPHYTSAATHSAFQTLCQAFTSSRQRPAHRFFFVCNSKAKIYHQSLAVTLYLYLHCVNLAFINSSNHFAYKETTGRPPILLPSQPEDRQL